MFNVTRKDMGEFAFFMSQPVMITFESGIQAIWLKAEKAKDYGRLSMMTGYFWVVVWMSNSLPWYVKGFRNAGITDDVIFGSKPFEIGSMLVENIFQ